MSDWQISVDSGQCVGSGLCAATAPGHFRVVDGHSLPVADRVAPADEVVEAAGMCPVEAISVRDSATGEPVAESPGGVVW